MAERKPRRGTNWPTDSYLGKLPPSAVKALLGAPDRMFAPGDVLLRQGSDSTHMFVIKSGMVTVSAAAHNGHTTLLAIRAIGDVVGEAAMVDHMPRMATVTATVPTQVVTVSEQEFRGLMARFPDIAFVLMRDITRKWRATTAARSEAGSYPVLVRVANILLGLAQSFGDEQGRAISLGVPLPQTQLAAMVDSSGPAIHKALRELRSLGAISTSYRQIVIEDQAKLVRIVAEARNNTGLR